jgi:hypothetical protein
MPLWLAPSGQVPERSMVTGSLCSATSMMTWVERPVQNVE